MSKVFIGFTVAFSLFALYVGVDPKVAIAPVAVAFGWWWAYGKKKPKA